MKTILSIPLLILFCLSACASSQITASITVTNKTTNGMTFTVNSTVRTWTNQLFNSGTQILTNSDVTGCGSKTNLFNQIGLNQYSQIFPIDTGSNTFQLVGQCGVALVVTPSAGYASVSYSTQVCATATPVGVPFANYYASLPTRTNTASQLALDIDTYDTNNTLLDLSKSQTATGAKTFSSSSGIWKGIVSQTADLANVIRGGSASNLFLNNPYASNLINYGNSLRSDGSGPGSQQFGSGSVASGQDSLGVGFSPLASGFGSTAVGYFAQAEGDYSIAMGFNPTATTPNAMAIGSSSDAEGTNSIAIGTGATANYNDSVAIGTGATTTSASQIMLGAAGISTVAQNNLTVQGNLNVLGGTTLTGPQTNSTYMGTNNFLANADIAFTRKSISSLANGNNAAVPIGTNVFIEVSGPSGSFTVNGMANGRDGKLIMVLNQTGFQMTVANESGTDPTAANRIKTGLSGDYVNTNNPGMVTFIYSGAASRWLLLSHN